MQAGEKASILEIRWLLYDAHIFQYILCLGKTVRETRERKCSCIHASTSIAGVSLADNSRWWATFHANLRTAVNPEGAGLAHLCPDEVCRRCSACLTCGLTCALLIVCAHHCARAACRSSKPSITSISRAWMTYMLQNTTRATAAPVGASMATHSARPVLQNPSVPGVGLYSP